MSYMNEKSLRDIEECGRSLREHFNQREKNMQDLIAKNEKLKVENEALRGMSFVSKLNGCEDSIPEKYFIEYDKRMECLEKDLENFDFKCILCDLLLHLRNYYQDQMILKKYNDIEQLKIFGCSEIMNYFRADGCFLTYPQVVNFLDGKLPEEVSNLLLF